MLLTAMRRDFIRFDLIEFLWSAQFKTKSKSKSNLVAIFATPFPFRFIHPPPPLYSSTPAAFAAISVRDLRVLFMF